MENSDKRANAAPVLVLSLSLNILLMLSFYPLPQTPLTISELSKWAHLVTAEMLYNT